MAENVTPVVLEIDGFAQREVMMIDYKFDQATDTEGQIAGIPRGGRVTIRVKALNDGNNELVAWMLDPTSPKNVSVKFVNTVDGAAMKELKGTNCYCINYVEKWEDGQQHFEEIEIVCQKLENGSVAFDNPWKQARAIIKKVTSVAFFLWFDGFLTVLPTVLERFLVIFACVLEIIRIFAPIN